MNPIRFVALSPTRSRALNVFLGVVVSLVALLLLLALATYHPTDPSLNTAADAAAPHAARNWVGLFGATLSDLLLQALGVSAFLIPLWLAGLGWSWMRSRSGGSALVRWLGSLLALAFVPTILALSPRHFLWLHALPAEGVTGRLLSALLVQYLNLQGAWIVSGVLAAAGLYFASALSVRAIWEGIEDRRFQLAGWRDRWRDWREQRAELKAEREAERRAARAAQRQARHSETHAGGNPSLPFIPGTVPPDADADPKPEPEPEPEPPYESLGQRPSRLASLFGRRRAPAPEPDPIEEIPAFQRVPLPAAEEAPDQPAEPPRRSLWERGPAADAPEPVAAPEPAFASAPSA
ncbi:MAG: DNA translocase FtsK 4TM domain-containing protein, partial [Terracidiphilus sp.]